MVVALTGNQKLALLVVAGIFIAFALASSFLFPRANPDYPGKKRLPLFIVVTALLLVSMLTAMVVFAREPAEEEAEAQAEVAAETERGDTQTLTEQGEPVVEGDPAAGKEVFSSAGCVACHTLADANATGAVGPNLDESQPDFELVVERVTNGQGAMPSFEGQLTEKQIDDVAAYVSQAAGSG